MLISWDSLESFKPEYPQKSRFLIRLNLKKMESQMLGRGKASSIFETDTISRDDLRYNGKKLTDPINTAEVSG